MKENIEVTLRLILPLDLCNASLLLIASSIGILIREHRTVLEPHVSMALLELDTIVRQMGTLTTVFHLHSF